MLGIAPGSVAITATYASLSASVSIAVRESRVAAEAVVVDSTRMRLMPDSAAEANGQFRFALNGTAPTLAPGKILVGAEGNGYLLKVVSTRQEGTSLVVQTTPAAITDVLKAGRFSLTVPITAGGGTPLPRTTVLAEGIQLGPPRILEAVAPVQLTAGGFDFSPFNLSLCLTSLNPGKPCGSVELRFPRSLLSFTADPKLDWDVDYMGLRKFTFLAGGTLEWDAVASIGLKYSADLDAVAYRSKCDPVVRSGSLACPRFVRRLLRTAYPFLVLVGGVPVKGDIILDFIADISLTAEASLSVAIPFRMSMPIALGIDVERGRPPSVGSIDFSGRLTSTPSVQTPNIGIGIKAAVKPRMSVRLYNSVSGFLEVEPFVRVGLQSPNLTDFDVVVAGGVAANVGASFEIFGKTMADLSTTVAEREWEWQRWTIVGRKVTQITLAPASPSLAIGQTQTLVATAYAADGSVFIPTPALTWSSSAPGTVGVDGTGRISALRAGRATVIASTNLGIVGSATVDVINVVARPVASVAGATWDNSVSPPRLKLDILAFDANGLRIGNFPASAFSIAGLTAGAARLTFQSSSASPVTPSNRGPFSTALVIDQSGSMSGSDPANARIAGSRQLVRQLLAGDEVALYTFASASTRLTALSSDINALDQALTRVGAPTGGTALYDAANDACMYVASAARNANRAVVLLTDGQDGGSRVTAAAAIANCRNLGVRVYTVGFGGAPPAVLAQVAMQTGGTATADQDVNVLLAALTSLPVTMRGANPATAVDFGVTVQGTLPIGPTSLSGTVTVDVSAGIPQPRIASGTAGSGQLATLVSAPFFVTIPATVPPAVSTVQVSLAGTLTVGQSTQATAVLRDAAGNVLTGRTVTWSSSNTAAATVSGSGIVTGIGPGVAQISAASEGRTGSATVTVNSASTTLYSDAFSNGLANWVVRSGTWTLLGGSLQAEYDIACGSPSCPQGILLLSDALQPTTSNWRAEIQLTQVRYNYGPGYDLTLANATFSLWVSDSEKLAVGGGYAVNNSAMPSSLSQVQWSVQRFPWSSVTGGTTNVTPWSPAQWNTFAIEKRGNQYTIFFNGISLQSFTYSFSQAPKIGLQVYGRYLLDNFKLIRL